MIKIVELFSGIGAQAKAFSRLGIDYEVVNTCEWDFHSILAYERIHCSPELLPEVMGMKKPDLLAVLSKMTLSSNGKAPIDYAALRTISEEGLRAILSAIRKTHNLINVTDVHADDLPDNIDLMTYSFPCQDLSNVGAFHGYQKGIDRDAGSRSGLLWEVERILWEMKEGKRGLPRFLLMENVAALLSKRHRANFEEWQTVLNNLGYTNQVYCLNATDFGLPQNRYRLLMLSVLTDGQRDKEEYVRRYFANHDLGVALYRDTLNIPHANLADYLRTDYSNETYYREATACQPMDTESRRRIWENNVQITDANGNILVDHVSTLTTKQDRDPNSGNLYMAPHDGLGSFRYLTPRECMILMGFDEADYEKLINNNVSLKKDLTAFPRDRIIRMAGNSIAVNVLVEVFRQMMVIHDTFYPKPGKPGHLPKTDVHDPETRSYNMSQIRAKNTKPEEIVAKHLFHAGFRKYVRNDSSLPGKPDISLKQFHTVVFINGCFWHGHEGCRYFKWPKSNQEFWKDKINANRERDKRNLDELAAAGWHVITVWECDLKERRDETLDALVHEIRQQPHRIYKKKRSPDTE